MWLRLEQKFSRNSFTCSFTTLVFLPRMKRTVIGLFGRVMNNNVVIIMLSSALIGCFTERLNVALFSYWQLISVTHRKETHGKYIFQYFLAQLYRWVIILQMKCGHQGAAITMLGTETAFKCTIAFYFRFRDRTNSLGYRLQVRNRLINE